MIEDIYKTISYLKTKSQEVDSEGYITEGYPGFNNHKIGIDQATQEAIILISAKNTEELKFYSIKLKSLEVYFDHSCDIIKSGEVSKRRFSVLRLKSKNDQILGYFFKFIDEIINSIGNSPDLIQVKEEITKVVNMFSKLHKPAKNTLQGLFGELCLIFNASNKKKYLEAWHKDSNSKFDFIFDERIIEVKSNSSNERKHKFSNSQLINLSKHKVPIIIASIIVLENDAGLTIFELVDKIEAGLKNTQLKNKLNDVVLDTLGESIETANDQSFHLSYASESTEYFDGRRLPCIDPEIISSAIYSVDLQIDLSSLKPINFSD